MNRSILNLLLILVLILGACTTSEPQEKQQILPDEKINGITIDWQYPIPKEALFLIAGGTAADDLTGIGVMNDWILVAAIAGIAHGYIYAISPEYRSAVESAGGVVVENVEGIREWAISVSSSKTNPWIWVEPYAYEEGKSGHIGLQDTELHIAVDLYWTVTEYGCKYHGQVNGEFFENMDPNPCHPKKFVAWLVTIRKQIEEVIGKTRTDYLFDTITAWIK